MQKSKKAFMVYQNETDSFKIGDHLTVENKLKRITIQGSLELTKDKKGLQHAYELKRVIDSVVETLKRGNLPECVETIDNFKTPIVRTSMKNMICEE